MTNDNKKKNKYLILNHDRYLLLDAKELSIIATSDLNDIDEGGSVMCIDEDDFKSSAKDAVRAFLGEKTSLSAEIAILIRNWVEENFDEGEVEDPSWNIEELAQHIATNL